MINWICVGGSLPEKDVMVLVYTPEGKYLEYAVDEWVELYETPVPFSSSTICVGEGWSEHDFDEISHWAYLNPPEENIK